MRTGRRTRTWTWNVLIGMATAVLLYLSLRDRTAPDPTPGTEEFRRLVERDLVDDLATDDPAARARFDLLADEPVYEDPPQKLYALWYEVEPGEGDVLAGVALGATTATTKGARFMFRRTTLATLRERPEIVFGRFPEHLHRDIRRRAGAVFGAPLLDAETVSEQDVFDRLDSESREDRRLGAYLAARHRVSSSAPLLLSLLDAVDDHGKPDVLLRAQVLDALIRTGVDVDASRLARAVVPGVEDEVVLLLAPMEAGTKSRTDALRRVREVAPDKGRAHLLAEVLLAEGGDVDAVATLVDRLRVHLVVSVRDAGSPKFGGIFGGRGDNDPAFDPLPLPPRATYHIEFAPELGASWWPGGRSVVVETPIRVESIRSETRDPVPTPRSIGAGDRDDVARATLGAILGDERLAADDGRESRYVEWRGADHLRAEVDAMKRELHAEHRALIDRMVARGHLMQAQAARPSLEISMQIVDQRKRSVEPLPPEFR